MKIICFFLFCHFLAASDYSLHFLWLSSSISVDYVFPPHRSAKTKSGLKTDDHMQNIVDWSHKNPTKNIHIWYDKTLCTDEAVMHSRKILQTKNLTNVTLHDLNTLKVVSDFKVFLTTSRINDTALPVYFRVDLFKMMITYQTLQLLPQQDFIFSDLDLVAMSESDLYDPITTQKLESFKYVFSQEGTQGYENCFHIFRYDDDMIDTLTIFFKYCSYYCKIKYETKQRIDPQDIYVLIPKMIPSIYYLKKGWVNGYSPMNRSLPAVLKNRSTDPSIDTAIIESINKAQDSYPEGLFIVTNIKNKELWRTDCRRISDILKLPYIQKVDCIWHIPDDYAIVHQNRYITHFYLDDDPDILKLQKKEHIPLLSRFSFVTLKVNKLNPKMMIPGKYIDAKAGLVYY